jgi:4'-phosphopantetheinyl transferase
MTRELALGGREVHVWTSRLGEGPPADLAVLSAEERARGERIRVPGGCEQWLTARARLRAILARYADVPAAAVELVAGEHGKPRLGSADGAGTELEFNLSHSDELALYAVARGRAVGIDTERVRGDLDFVALARRALDPETVEELERAPVGDRPAQFAAAWARHEARLKCLGVGLGAAADPQGLPVTVVDLAAPAGFAAALALPGRVTVGPGAAVPDSVAGVPGCSLQTRAVADARLSFGQG